LYRGRPRRQACRAPRHRSRGPPRRTLNRRCPPTPSSRQQRPAPPHQHSEPRRRSGSAGSCPRWWCRSTGSLPVSGGSGRLCQAATAGSLTKGSSLKPAIVSRVM
jgi:hypothetical protein